MNYRNKIEGKVIQGDMRTVWHGIKNMPDINIIKKVPVEKRNADFSANDLNLFFTCFEKDELIVKLEKY